MESIYVFPIQIEYHSFLKRDPVFISSNIRYPFSLYVDIPQFPGNSLYRRILLRLHRRKLTLWMVLSYNIMESKGKPMINGPLIRPYFSGGWYWEGPLRFP